MKITAPLNSKPEKPDIQKPNKDPDGPHKNPEIIPNPQKIPEIIPEDPDNPIPETIPGNPTDPNPPEWK